MGRRLQAWGNPDLSNPKANALIAPLGYAYIQKLARAWKTLPSLIGGASPDENASRVSHLQDLLISRIGTPDDRQWYSRRPLGAGGFGVAALFEKMDENGDVVDVSSLLLARAFTELIRN